MTLTHGWKCNHEDTRAAMQTNISSRMWEKSVCAWVLMSPTQTPPPNHCRGFRPTSSDVISCKVIVSFHIFLYANTKHQIDPAAVGDRTSAAASSPPPPAQTSFGKKSPKSLLNKTMVLVSLFFCCLFFSGGQGEGWDAEGADISLLWKCSFPHKQKREFRTAELRGESQRRASVAFVCVLSAKARHRRGEVCAAARRKLAVPPLLRESITVETNGA